MNKITRHVPYWIKLLKLSGPIFLSFLGVQLMELTDLLMIGQLGVIPVAAAAFVNGLISVFLTVGIGFTASVSTLVARSSGRNLVSKCNSLIHNGVWLDLGVGLLCIGILEIFRRNLHWFGQSPEVVSTSGDYFLWIQWSVLPQYLFQVHKQFTDGKGQTLDGSVAIILSLFVNIFCNWVLIYGKLGFPAYGLVGAGMGTFLSRLILWLAYFIYLIKCQKFSKYNFGLFPLSIDRQMMRSQVSIGFPAGLQYLFEVGVFSAATIMAGWISPVALASHQIALKITTSCYNLPLSFSLAVCVRIGDAVGKNKFQSAKNISRSAFTLSFCCMSVIALGLWLGKDHIPLWFLDSLEVLETASPLLVIAALFQLFDGTQAVAIGVLRGLLDTRIPAVLTFISYWMISLPVSWLLAFYFDGALAGLWYGLMLGLACSAILLNIRIYRLFRSPESLALAT